MTHWHWFNSPSLISVPMIYGELLPGIIRFWEREERKSWGQYFKAHLLSRSVFNRKAKKHSCLIFVVDAVMGQWSLYSAPLVWALSLARNYRQGHYFQ
jgi:hypothetical protein